MHFMRYLWIDKNKSPRRFNDTSAFEIPQSALRYIVLRYTLWKYLNKTNEENIKIFKDTDIPCRIYTRRVFKHESSVTNWQRLWPMLRYGNLYSCHPSLVV